MRANAVALLQVKTLELWIQKLPTVAPRMMASMVKERSAGPLHLMVSDWDWKDVYVPGTLKGKMTRLCFFFTLNWGSTRCSATRVRLFIHMCEWDTCLYTADGDE